MKAIITFHSIDDERAVLSYSPALFERLLDGLETSGAPVLSLDALLDPQTERGVALTFDDGMKSVHRHALPIFRGRGLTAHMFLVAGAVEGGFADLRRPKGAPDYDLMSWDEAGDLMEAGFHIDAHTYSHPDLRQLPDEAVREEFVRTDALIAARLGRAPGHFAYPFGYYDERIERLAGERYRTSVTTRLAYLGARDRTSALPRLDSYYLRDEGRLRDVFSFATRSYIHARGALRWVRGKIWNANHA
jgi:peptidoglycan/xylan/chitin deacetylase (PgdA/CDA1 family)